MKFVNPNDAYSRFEVIINNKNSFADVRFFGGVTLELANSALLQIMEHHSFRHNMDACYDFTDAIIETDMKELEQHSEFVRQHVGRRGSHYKLALVTDETLNSALLNVYKLVISKTTIEAEVFGSKKQSLIWLNSKH